MADPLTPAAGDSEYYVDQVPKTYSLDKLYTKVKDRQGHSEHWRIAELRLHDGVASAAQHVIDLTGLYASRQEFIRDAIYHRVIYWQGKLNDDTITQIVGPLRIEMMVDQFMIDLEKYARAVGSIERLFYSNAAGAREQALILARSILSQLDGFPSLARVVEGMLLGE